MLLTYTHSQTDRYIWVLDSGNLKICSNFYQFRKFSTKQLVLYNALVKTLETWVVFHRCHMWSILKFDIQWDPPHLSPFRYATDSKTIWFPNVNKYQVIFQLTHTSIDCAKWHQRPLSKSSNHFNHEIQMEFKKIPRKGLSNITSI